MDNREEKINLLKAKVKELLPQPGVYQTAVSSFRCSLRTEKTFNRHCFYTPMSVIVLQGKKEAVLGSEKFEYSAGQAVVTSIDIPTVGNITEASPEKPFMSLVLELDNYVTGELLSGGTLPRGDESSSGMGICTADEALLDAFYRLISLPDGSEKQKIMAPMIIKEIHYLLLTSPLGGILRSVNTKGSRNNKIVGAIAWLKENYRKPLKIDELAQKFNMAESSFYRHFSKVTTISPLQYQKQLRLYEAQRLMLSENFDAANAAYEVGYESPCQFNREYKRMFGLPPRESVSRMKSI